MLDVTDQPPPAPAAAPGRAAYAAVAAVAVVLVAGCCAGGRALTAGDEPVSSADYAAALAAADAAITLPAPDRRTKNHIPLVRVLRAEAGRLGELDPPQGAGRAHRLAESSLLALANELAGPRENTCTAAVATTALLSSAAAGSVRLAARDLAAADPAYVFGTFLPAEPAATERRLRTGAWITKPSRKNAGVLTVRNSSGGGDATVSLVPVGSGDPAFTVYLRDADTVTVRNVADGAYRLYTAAGRDWEARAKGFTRDCVFRRFDDTLRFGGAAPGRVVELPGTSTGNAGTTEVDPRTFPGV
jgi:hypothetical protein